MGENSQAYHICYYTHSTIISPCSQLQPSLQFSATSTTIKSFHTELPWTKYLPPRLRELMCVHACGHLKVKQFKKPLLLHA